MNRRRIILESGADDMGKEWKLLNEQTTTEEKVSIDVEFDSGYEELSIVCGLAGSSQNANLTNKNLCINLYGESNDLIVGLCGNCIMTNGVNRVVYINYTKYPFPKITSDAGNTSDVSIDDNSFSQSVSPTAISGKRNFSGAVKKISIRTFNDLGVIGSGSKIAIYGR